MISQEDQGEATPTLNRGGHTKTNQSRAQLIIIASPCPNHEIPNSTNHGYHNALNFQIDHMQFLITWGATSGEATIGGA